MNKLKKLFYVSLCSSLINLSAYSVNYKMLDYAAEDISQMISENIPITAQFVESKLGFVDTDNDSWEYVPDLQKNLKTPNYETLLSDQRLERMNQFQIACQTTIDSYEGAFPVMQNGVQLLHNSVMKKSDDYAFSRQQDRIVRDMYRQERQLQLLHKRKAVDTLTGTENKRSNFDKELPAMDGTLSLEQVY